MPETVHNTAVHVEGLRFRSLPEDTRGARAPASGFILAGTLFVPAGADYKKSAPLPGLVVGHGAGSNRNRHEEFCRTACGKGMAVMALDMRGHGESGGEADGPLHRDIVAAVEVLRSHPLVDPNRIGYRGSSMGDHSTAQSDPLIHQRVSGWLIERLLGDARA